MVHKRIVFFCECGFYPCVSGYVDSRGMEAEPISDLHFPLNWGSLTEGEEVSADNSIDYVD